MSVIRFQSVGKDFGSETVLEDINLEIQSGEFVVFVGPSGCGKSTLLRILSGLEKQSRGDVFIGNKRINALPPKDRDIAMVFQNYALYPHMTVYQNLEFPLRNQSMPKHRRDEIIRATAGLLSIDTYLDRYPRELSGGQRQRVAMGRAIVREPQVFLFDEPLSNLDAALRSQMRREIKQLHRRLKTTLVYVTHDQVEAMTMADRVAVMKEGKLLQVGTPGEIYTAPKNEFVARFVGTPAINIIRVRDGKDNAESIARDPVFDLSILDHVSGMRDVDSIGVRPEHVMLERPNVNRKANGRVEFRESDGRDHFVSVRYGELTITAAGQACAEFQSGQPVCVTLNKAHLLCFDRDGLLLKS